MFLDKIKDELRKRFFPSHIKELKTEKIKAEEKKEAPTKEETAEKIEKTRTVEILSKKPAEPKIVEWVENVEKSGKAEGEDNFEGPGFSGTYGYTLRVGARLQDFGMRRKKHG